MDDQVSAIVADLNRYTEGEVIDLTLEVTAILREVTPRDTGWAAANWIPTIGQPGPAVPALKGRATQGEVAAAAARSAEGQAAVANYKLENGAVFVTNGVPYIRPLNEGWSKKAPEAFVQASVAMAVARVGSRR